MRKYEGATERIKNNANNAADAFRGMFATFLGINALQGLAKTADDMMLLEHRIGELQQTTGTAAEGFDFVAKKASEARQSIDTYGNFFVKAGKATQDYVKTQEELTEITDSVAFALAASGQSAASQSQAFYQLGQAIGSPTVQMEEMATVIDVAPDLFKAIGDAIPAAAGNLKDFMKAGKLTGELFAKTLVQVLPQFRDEILKMPMSIGVATLLINNRWKEFVNKMNRQSGAVTLIAETFLNVFDVIEKGVYKFIDVIGGATNAVKLFGTIIAAILVPLMFKGFIGALALLVSPIGLLVAGLTLVGLALEDFYQWMNGGESVFGDFFGSFEQYRPGFLAAWEMIKSAVGIASDFLTTAFNTIKNEFNTVMAGGLMADIQGFIAIVVPILKLFADFLLNWIPWETIAAGFKTFFEGVVQVIGGVVNVATGLIKMLYGALTLDGERFVAGFKQLFGGVGVVIDGIVKAIAGAMSAVFASISKMFGLEIDKVKARWEGVKKFFGFGGDGTKTDPATQPGAQPRIGFGTPFIPPMTMNPSKMNPATVAGAATAPAGVPTGGGGSSSITINQQLPAGSAPEVKRAAKEGGKQAAQALDPARLGRGFVQVQ